MPRVQYYLPGVPDMHAGAGSSAFTPSLSWAAASGAVAYKYGVHGGPGVAHPMTALANTEMDTGHAAVAAMGTGRSSEAPDCYWTDDYDLSNYDRAGHSEYPGAGMPVKVYNPTRAGPTTLLPVPASDYRARYQEGSARLSRRAILQRMKSLPWFPRIYPGGSGTFNG